MAEKLKLTFCSGTQEVTGANYLLEEENGKKILIDCGLIQKTKMADEENWEPFPYDPAAIDILFVTHSHIDHIGRIPKLINDGFRGKIYSTPPTKEIAEYMLEDTANIIGKDKEHGLDKIYSETNIKKALELWETLPYHEVLKLGEDLQVRLLDSGHILGSAMVEFICNNKKIIFTGDLGNSPSPILPDAEAVSDAHYLIMESVYGDRNHESRAERRDMLEDAIEDTVKRKGVLLMPTFSLERSQELLFEIDAMQTANRIPLLSVFLDSPLAIKLTSVFRKYKNYFKEEVKKMIESGNDVFMFPGLLSTLETEQSKMIANSPKPKIIIAGSGMSAGGRIVHHEKLYLPDPNSILLLTGYQTPGTLGRFIQDGAKKVRVAGEEVLVKAEVRNIGGYSGHKDSDALLSFVQGTVESVRTVFVVMGEPKSSYFLVQKLRDYLGLDARAPEKMESIELEC